MAFELATAKMYLRLTDTDDDAMLSRFGEEADEAVDNFLISVVGSTNVDAVNVTDQINDLSNYMAVKKYYLSAQNFDGAEKWQVEIDALKKSIRERLVSVNSGTAAVVGVPPW